MSNSLTYDKLGASSSKAGLHDVLNRVNKNNNSQKYFCQILEDFANDNSYASFVHCDGAGTKSIIPYLIYKATGDTSYFKRLAQDALVMNLDDVFCLGIPESLVLANAIARNSRHIKDFMIEEIISGYNNLANELSELGIKVTLGGGETADCGDIVRTLVVDATMVGRIPKNSLINPNNISPGDVIVGFSSSGKSTYETNYNSGIGSNGLTLARHAILSKECVSNSPEVIDPTLESAISYCGKYLVTDSPSELNMTIGDALSSPTRTYAPLLLKIYEQHLSDITGVIHLTGGAHGKALRFLQPCLIVKDNLLPSPPIFKLIQEGANISDVEMHKVFNMGQRLEIYCKESIAEKLIDISKSFNIDAQKIGYVEKIDSNMPQTEIRKGNKSFRISL